MEKQALKKLLKNIKDNDYAVPYGVKQRELSLEMMENIGDVDSELRDDLILSILSNWIIQGEIEVNILNELLVIALDEKHLLNGLGEVSDTVFSRTFSAEIVAAIIYKHREKKFLSKTQIKETFAAVLKFYNEDRDVRGFIEGKGWAHGAAHGADAIDELARCEEIGYEELKEILEAIHKKINVNHYGYIHFEDERLITPVKAILERKLLSIEEVVEWINSFKQIDKTGKYPEDLVIDFNVNAFLKSLYFRLIDTKDYEILAQTAKSVLKEISRFSEY